MPAHSPGSLAGNPCVREVDLFGPASPRVGIASLALAGNDPARVADRLAAEHGIGVRAAQFCAHPLVRHLTGRLEAGTCGVAPVLLPVSFGLGTTADDLDRFVVALPAWLT